MNLACPLSRRDARADHALFFKFVNLWVYFCTVLLLLLLLAEPSQCYSNCSQHTKVHFGIFVSGFWLNSTGNETVRTVRNMFKKLNDECAAPGFFLTYDVYNTNCQVDKGYFDAVFSLNKKGIRVVVGEYCLYRAAVVNCCVLLMGISVCLFLFLIFKNCSLSSKIYNMCQVIVYCDVVNVQPRFNFSNEIIK